jgi:hypothetical protein
MNLKVYGVGDAVFSEGVSWERFHLLIRLRVVLAVAPSNDFIVAIKASGCGNCNCPMLSHFSPMVTVALHNSDTFFRLYSHALLPCPISSYGQDRR